MAGFKPKCRRCASRRNRRLDSRSFSKHMKLHETHSRLSGVLHVLLHMAEANGPMTSETLAKAMETNTVVIRRIMGGLREAGFVRSEKGQRGRLDPRLRPGPHHAAGHLRRARLATLLAIGNRTEAPGCLVEQSVNAALGETSTRRNSCSLRRLAKSPSWISAATSTTA